MQQALELANNSFIGKIMDNQPTEGSSSTSRLFKRMTHSVRNTAVRANEAARNATQNSRGEAVNTLNMFGDERVKRGAEVFVALSGIAFDYYRLRQSAPTPQEMQNASTNRHDIAVGRIRNRDPNIDISYEMVQQEMQRMDNEEEQERARIEGEKNCCQRNFGNCSIM